MLRTRFAREYLQAGTTPALARKHRPGTIVFAVVDVFNALTSRRTYKEPFKDIQDVGIST